MHTLASALVALSVEKYYTAPTEIQLQILRFHGSLSQTGSRPLINFHSQIHKRTTYLQDHSWFLINVCFFFYVPLVY